MCKLNFETPSTQYGREKSNKSVEDKDKTNDYSPCRWSKHPNENKHLDRGAPPKTTRDTTATPDIPKKMPTLSPTQGHPERCVVRRRLSCTSNYLVYSSHVGLPFGITFAPLKRSRGCFCSIGTRCKPPWCFKMRPQRPKRSNTQAN